MKFVVGILVEKVIKAIINFVADYLESIRLKNKAKKRIKEIINATKDDPKERAARINDWLNS